jgi:hypothetical protein
MRYFVQSFFAGKISASGEPTEQGEVSPMPALHRDGLGGEKGRHLD